MMLSELLKDVDIKESFNIDCNIDIKQISSNSKNINANSLFVCIKGLINDGHDFIPQAIYSGARVIILEEKGAAAIKYPYIQVDNTRAALSQLWHNWYGRPGDRLQLIAVTGTNGKTSTVAILKDILLSSGYKTGVIGTVTHSMTTPDPEQLYQILHNMAEEKFDYVCMETSSHALAFDKLAPLNFIAGIFTNLTQDHLDFHHNMQNYRKAKGKLFKQCKLGIFNYDDPQVRITADESPCEKVYYSAQSKMCDYYATDINISGINGITYKYNNNTKNIEFTSPLIGMFGVYNTLAAATCAVKLGVNCENIASTLKNIIGIAGRLERVPLINYKIAAYIDYAHTPDALEKALKCLRDAMNYDNNKTANERGRLTVLFGCGGDRDAGKRPVMGAIASRLADFTIITSDNSRTEEPSEIIKQILRGVDKESPYIVIENRREAIYYAIRSAMPGDVVLFAGKGHEKYEINKSGVHPFDERVIINEAQSGNNPS